MYNHEECFTRTASNDFVLKREPGKLCWLDVRGLQDVALLESIGKEFDLHPLVMEDIFNVRQRPKFEEYPNGIFIIARSLRYEENAHLLETEQIAIFFSNDFLVSFQENNDDTFKPVLERLQSGSGRIRSRGTDYLAYTLLDYILDNYFIILDHIELELEKIENELTINPSDRLKSALHDLKFQLLYLRKSVIPLREAINAFARADSIYVQPETEFFLRDLFDHAIRVADLVDTYRDITNGLQELYLSELSLRMSKVMQLLTIITTFFVPLTFIVGIYGMNFKYMPELEWKYGYPAVWAIMLLLVLVLTYIFRKKKWL